MSLVSGSPVDHPELVGPWLSRAREGLAFRLLAKFCSQPSDWNTRIKFLGNDQQVTRGHLGWTLPFFKLVIFGGYGMVGPSYPLHDPLLVHGLLKVVQPGSIMGQISNKPTSQLLTKSSTHLSTNPVLPSLTSLSISRYRWGTARSPNLVFPPAGTAHP